MRQTIFQYIIPPFEVLTDNVVMMMSGCAFVAQRVREGLLAAESGAMND